MKRNQMKWNEMYWILLCKYKGDLSMESILFCPLMSINSVCKYDYELTKLELRRQQQQHKIMERKKTKARANFNYKRKTKDKNI